LPTLKNFEEEL